MSSVAAAIDARQVSAAILAGGEASRYGGTDKGSLLVGGRRIIDRQLAALSSVAGEILIVSNHRERYADLPIPVIPDAVLAAGPMGGLMSALQAATAPWVLVLACDLP